MFRIIIIIMAVLAAGTVSIMTSRYLMRQEERVAEAEKRVELVDVLVANTDMNLGQTVTENKLRWTPWPKEGLPSRYLTKQTKPDAIKQLIGSVVRQPIAQGEPIVEGKLAKRDGSSILAVALQEGYRAVTIKVDEARGLAGLIRPGDLVDVILTHRISTPSETGERGERTVSEVVAENIRILAIDQALTGNGEEKAKPAKAITLEVTAQQAEAITLGSTTGTISLALRSAFAETLEKKDEDVGRLLAMTAARDLQTGTLLRDEDVSWLPLPKGEDSIKYIVEERSGRANYKGALLTADITQGQPIKRADVIKASERRFVSLALRPGYRGLSVSLASNSAAGGFVYPGDIVDIVYTSKAGGRSEVIASGVRVLSVETGLDPRTQLPSGGGTATLEVTPQQAQRLNNAVGTGQLSIMLRPIPEQVSILEAQSKGITEPPVTEKKQVVRRAPAGGYASEGGLIIIRGLNPK